MPAIASLAELSLWYKFKVELMYSISGCTVYLDENGWELAAHFLFAIVIKSWPYTYGGFKH